MQHVKQSKCEATDGKAVRLGLTNEKSVIKTFNLKVTNDCNDLCSLIYAIDVDRNKNILKLVISLYNVINVIIYATEILRNIFYAIHKIKEYLMISFYTFKFYIGILIKNSVFLISDKECCQMENTKNLNTEHLAQQGIL